MWGKLQSGEPTSWLSQCSKFVNFHHDHPDLNISTSDSERESGYAAEILFEPNAATVVPTSQS